jgi:hypothetical protein
LGEAYEELKRLRFQAKVSLASSVVLLLFLSRFLVYVFVNVGPPPFNPPPFQTRPPNGPSLFFIPVALDVLGLLVALVAVLWSLAALIKQRRFVARWDARFEKIDKLEKQLMPDEKA